MTAPRRLGFAFWSFILFMLGLTVLFAWLGIWQLERLAEKDALVAEVDRQLTQPPYELPPAGQWDAIDLETYAYHPLTLIGTYRNDDAVIVFTNLSEPNGQYGGPGYWVMTPFEARGGGIVFVNRGFIPQDFQEAAVTDGEGDDSQVTISGLLRPAEATGFMTPEPNMSDRIEWVRDPARLAKMVDPAMAPFAPFYVDLPAGPPGELPQGGETVVEFPNNHLGYAYTWFGFAIVAVVMLGFWLARQRAAGKG